MKRGMGGDLGMLMLRAEDDAKPRTTKPDPERTYHNACVAEGCNQLGLVGLYGAWLCPDHFAQRLHELHPDATKTA